MILPCKDGVWYQLTTRLHPLAFPMLQLVLNNPLTIACGISIVLVSCSSPPAGEGNRPNRFVTVQPIQICNDFGIFCADLALFEDETKKIWSQADIEVDFLDPVRLDETRFLTIDSQDEFAELSFSGGTGAFGRHPLSTRTSGPVNMWFVERIFDGLFDSFGLAWIDQNGVLISDDILSFNNGVGRRDTVAHELGHNLGLTHSNFGAGPSNNLMSSGGLRNIPSSTSDITPDGARLSQLTPDQIDFARDSNFVTPSPGPSSNGGSTGLPNVLPPFLDAAPLPVTADSGDVVVIANQSHQEKLLNPPASTLPIAEAAPMDQRTAQTEVLVVNRHPVPQKIPDGPGMPLLSAGILAGFLWHHRPRKLMK